MSQPLNFTDNDLTRFEMTLNEHTGTYIEAPLYFAADGLAVNEIPVSSLIAPLCVIDIAAHAAENPGTQVTPDDLQSWIDTHGDIPDGAYVALHSGCAAKVATDELRGFNDEKQHYPGFHAGATQMLLQTGAGSIPSDTLSLDHGIFSDFATHYVWPPAGRFGIVNIANLDKVPAARATLVIGAPTHEGGTGGPARIFAIV